MGFGHHDKDMRQKLKEQNELAKQGGGFHHHHMRDKVMDDSRESESERVDANTQEESNNEVFQGENEIPRTEQSTENGPPRVRRRIKVRKRVRIKKKPNPKKKLRKIAEKSFWILVVIGFVISLIVMIVQLDISDQKFKAKKKKNLKSSSY